jgi:hypothetical protein
MLEAIRRRAGTWLARAVLGEIIEAGHGQTATWGSNPQASRLGEKLIDSLRYHDRLIRCDAADANPCDAPPRRGARP